MKKLGKDNLGFTLVELIIVIAIIAILGIVVAPQYIKYVEKSRQSTDLNSVTEMARATALAMFATPGLPLDPGGIKFIITDTGEVIADYANTVTEGYAEHVSEIIPKDSCVFQSNLYRGETITINVDGDGVVTWTSALNGTDQSAVPSSSHPYE